MAVTKKIDKGLLKAAADTATAKQVVDIFSDIEALGSDKPKSGPVIQSGTNINASPFPPAELKAGDEQAQETIQFKPEKPADGKPGYVSVVIPNSLKKRWKTFSMNHDLTLTESIKLGMMVLEEMERRNEIRIEGGFLVYNR